MGSLNIDNVVQKEELSECTHIYTHTYIHIGLMLFILFIKTIKLLKLSILKFCFICQIRQVNTDFSHQPNINIVQLVKVISL